jgi:hypothetical protein
MFRTLKNHLGERSNNIPALDYTRDNDDGDEVEKENDGVGGVVSSIPPSVTFSWLSLSYGGETHQPASLPSWCPSWMETHWRMALEGITTLSTWLETTYAFLFYTSRAA